AYPAAFDDARALGGGVLQEDMVEFRSPDLEGVGKALVPGVGKIEADRLVVPGRDELDAVFGHADPGDLLADAEFLEERHIHRQQRLADVKPRVPVLLDEDDALAAGGKEGGDRSEEHTSELQSL